MGLSQIVFDNVLPIEPSGVIFQTGSVIASETPPADAATDIDLLIGMSIIDWKVALIYFACVVATWYVFIRCKWFFEQKKITKQYKRRLAWELAITYLNQVNFTLDMNHVYLYVLVFTHVLGYYGLWAYFGAVYSTDLVVQKSVRTVKNYKDIVEMNRNPIILHTDPVVSMLRASKEGHLKVLMDRLDAKARKDANDSTINYIGEERNKDQAVAMVERIREGEVAIGQASMAGLTANMYCNGYGAGSTDYHNLNLSPEVEPFVMYAYNMRKNLSRELKEEIRIILQRLTESYIPQKKIFEIEGLFPVQTNAKFYQCLYGDPPATDIIPLKCSILRYFAIMCA